MSYQIIDEKIVGKTVSADGSFMQMKLMHIVCDAAADIPAPEPAWSAGSRCDVLADSGNVYILSISGEWKQVNFYNQGGGGGGFDPDNYYTKSQTDSIISGKVDKVTGKGLSTEDYTTAEKTKLAGIETGANKITVDSALSSSSTNPVQNKTIKSALNDKISLTGCTHLSGPFEPQQNYGANLGSSNFRFDKIYGKNLYLTNSLIYVGNSATGVDVTNLVEKEQGKGLSTEDFTTAEKTKLAGIETGAKANIQSDWGQSDSTADDFIKNKPTLGSAASRSVVLSLSNAGSGLPTSGTVYSALNNKVDKVTGKGLSTEDFTTAEKNSLSILSELDTATVTIDLNSQTWTESANGLFYTGNISVTNLYRALSAIITGFSALKPTDNVAVIANSDKTAIRLTASTNTFSNQANITVSVFGRFTS